MSTSEKTIRQEETYKEVAYLKDFKILSGKEERTSIHKY